MTYIEGRSLDEEQQFTTAFLDFSYTYTPSKAVPNAHVIRDFVFQLLAKSVSPGQFNQNLKPIHDGVAAWHREVEVHVLGKDFKRSFSEMGGSPRTSF